MEFTEISTYGAMILYLLGSGGHICGLLSRKEKPKIAGGIISGLGFVLHGSGLGRQMIQDPAMALASSEFYLSLFSFSLLFVLFVLWFRLKLSFLGLVATPLAMFLLMASTAATSTKIVLPSSLSGLFFGLHIGCLFAAIGLLAMACAAGIGYLNLERRIKTKAKFTGVWAAMPPLESLDKANHLAVALGLPLYTIGLVSGFIWAKITWNRFFSWDPKEIAAVLIWLLFAFLFHQRLALGWRGRKTAWLAIWVFGLCLVSMLGINFLVKTHHSLA